MKIILHGIITINCPYNLYRGSVISPIPTSTFALFYINFLNYFYFLFHIYIRSLLAAFSQDHRISMVGKAQALSLGGGPPCFV